MTDIKFRAWCSIDNTMIAPSTIQQMIENGCSSGFTDYCKFMQYTGLKDANGVEIYEGDILTGDNCVWLVSMNSSGCYVAHHPSITIEFAFLDDYDFRIIGNIHQNPELLS